MRGASGWDVIAQPNAPKPPRDPNICTNTPKLCPLSHLLPPATARRRRLGRDLRYSSGSPSTLSHAGSLPPPFCRVRFRLAFPSQPNRTAPHIVPIALLQRRVALRRRHRSSRPATRGGGRCPHPGTHPSRSVAAVDCTDLEVPTLSSPLAPHGVPGPRGVRLAGAGV